MLNINCPWTHVTGTACISKLASAVVTCSIFGSASHSIVHLSSRRLQCNCKWPTHKSQVWQQFVFWRNICFGLLALISAVLTPNNATRLTWQSCAGGIVTRLTDATSQCSLTQPAMYTATQSHRALTL